MNFSESLPLAFLIGVAFGAALERAGLGSAPKLAGQFTLRDLTVFKVLFSALLTAMLGAFWLAQFGWLDLASLYVPETWLLPQLVGGLVFGLGFVLSGLCPGTACVAAASGRGDGLASMLGLLLGVLGGGLLFPMFEGFYASTARGTYTLPQLLQLPQGVVVLGVVLMALGAFRAVAWWEQRA